MAWDLDVEVESTPLSTTGGHTWAAARRLAAYLAAATHQLGLTAPGLKVLELGAGTGWLGCTVARNLHPSALVCLTEQEGGLAWLRHNVQSNRRRGLPLGGVRVQACDWLDFAEGAAGTTGGVGSGAPCSDGRGAAVSSNGSICGSSSGGAGVPGGSSSQGPQQQQVAAACGRAEGSSGRGREGGSNGSGAAKQTQQQQDQQQHDQQQQQVQLEHPDQRAGSTHTGSAEVAGAEVAGAVDLDLRSVRWDFIVGSDLIYNEIGSRCLPRVLAALAGPATQVLYCHTKHRFDLLDWEFFEQLEACGLSCEEVWEPGAVPPPQSPPAQFPPADLFPEQRIAVYRISRNG